MLVLLLNSVLILAAVMPADGFYPFSVDQDALSGAPDFSFLNHPLGPADRLFVKNGHFYRVGPDLLPNTSDDAQVRLFGANLVWEANFPIQSDARRIATRLRRLGINLVRLQGLDAKLDDTPSEATGLLTIGPYPTLNPVSVQRLRNFLNTLKAEGVYADLVLHDSYEFRPAVDPVPSLGSIEFPPASNPLHIFYPRMIELQADYARQVIDALQLKGDPALGLVEINNESSLVDAYIDSNLEPSLVGDYRKEFQRQWNVFLGAKYSSTASLENAWGNTQPDGPELLNGQWSPLELHQGAQASFLTAPNASEIQVKVNSAAAADSVILKQIGFSVGVGGAYLALVEIRADLLSDTTRDIYWKIKQNNSPYSIVDSRTVTISNQWREYALKVNPGFALNGNGRFGLSVGNAVGVPIHVRNASLRQAGMHGLSSGESLKAVNISLVSEFEISADARTNDYFSFLVDRDRYYLDQIQSAVQEQADLLVPITGTQMSQGGLPNLDSHDNLSYQDNHFYEDHYFFPNRHWDDEDWGIRDSSTVGGGLVQVLNTAAAREGNRPYTVSEFNQPWPNTHAAEIDPVLAAFGAFQDWDALMHFDYFHNRDWDIGVPNRFSINGDWTKFPLLGQSAWLFRSGAISSGDQMIAIPLSKGVRLQAGRDKSNGGTISTFLNSTLGYERNTALKYHVSLDKDNSGPLTETAKQKLSFPIVSETGETSYDGDQKLFLVHAPQAAGIFGFSGQNAVTAGVLDLELGPSARGFVSLLLTSLDGLPLSRSGHLLLSNPGYTLPTEPGSSPVRPLPLVNYGSSSNWWTLKSTTSKPSGSYDQGTPPVWMERVESILTFRTAATQLSVYPLDGKGSRLEKLKEADAKRIEGGFRIHLQADGQRWSPWYELVTEGASIAIFEQRMQERTRLPQRSPRDSR